MSDVASRHPGACRPVIYNLACQCRSQVSARRESRSTLYVIYKIGERRLYDQFPQSLRMLAALADSMRWRSRPISELAKVKHTYPRPGDAGAQLPTLVGFSNEHKK